MTPVRHSPLVLLLAVLAVLLGAGPASAEDGFRYWNYSHLEDGAFVFAETGPGEFVPENGSVEGWRFGTSTVGQGIEPRADLSKVTFEAVCGDTQPKADEKRVAVLVDYGTEKDANGAEVPAPRAACAAVPQDANGLQTLESVVEVRSEKSMICALDGYPAKGCGEPVGDATVPTDEPTVEFTLTSEDAGSAGDSADDSADGGGGGGVSWPLIGVGVLVVVLAAVAVPLYRRNRES